MGCRLLGASNADCFPLGGWTSQRGDDHFGRSDLFRAPHARTGEKPWGRYLDQTALFHVVADPREQKDIAQDQNQVDTIQRLKQQLDQWWTPTNTPNHLGSGCYKTGKGNTDEAYEA
jgi:hypothetical protein